MKKIIVNIGFLVTTIYASEDSILGEFGNSPEVRNQNFSIDVGTWYMIWNQESRSSEILNNKNDTLNTKYNINNSIASIIKGYYRYKKFSSSFEYYNNNFSKSENDNDEVKGFKLALILVDLIPHVDVETRIIKANFKGDIEVQDNSSGDISSGIFTTKLKILDFIVYPFNKYLGVGYRKYSYEVPQDLYLVNNKDNSLVESGIDDIKYDGSFYTVLFDNTRLVNRKTNYNGLIYSFSYGIGVLSPKSTTNSNLNQYYADSDAKYIDILAGYSYRKKRKNKFGYGFNFGYRYNKIETTPNKTNNEYSVITKFNTEFHGPFANLVINY